MNLDSLTQEDLKKIDLSKMSREEKFELFDALEERKRNKSRRFIDTIFPETGPLRRELYIPHMEFFEAGAYFRERAFMAANRSGKCVTYQTLIDTSMGQIPIGELYERGKSFEITAWDEDKKVKVPWTKADAPFKKPQKEECVRLEMSDGQWIECALDHRILTNQGWQFVADVLPFISCDDVPSEQTLPESNSAPFLSTLKQGVSRLTQKALSSLDRYSGDHRQYGEQLLLCPDISQLLVPLSDDDPAHISSSYSVDDQGYKYTSSRQPEHVPPSIPDVISHASAQYVEFSVQAFYTVSQWLPGVLQKIRQLSTAATVLLQSILSISSRQVESSSCDLSPLYVEGNKIVSYKPIGRQDVYDFTVPVYRSYLAGGLIHHNTITGATELVYHLTGSYPDWWKGKRFKGRIDAWAAGKSNETTRDILQEKLLGPMNAIGTGLIPGDMIVGEPRRKPGVPDAIASVQIKNVQGGISTLTFKSYEQGRTSFEGVEKHVILLDEEPPIDIYGECLIRTMATGGFSGGIILLTFTPLQGMSDVVLAFMPGGKVPDRHDKTSNKFIVSATWEDAPHLSDEEMEDLRRSIPPYQLDARSKGIPQLGSGAIFPIAESDIVVPDFPLPAYWPRSYGFDHGWNATAATWAAWNIEPEKPIFYLTDEYKRGMTEPEVHASNVKLRGDWIPGVSDPAAGTSSADGVQLVKTYQKMIPGLTVAPKGKAGNVESGLFNMLLAMSEGRFKVFESCQGWLSEFRLYRRDKNGKVVKENDHEMDSSRYVYEKGPGFAKIMPVKLFAQRQGLGQKDYDPLTFGLKDDYDPLTNGF